MTAFEEPEVEQSRQVHAHLFGACRVHLARVTREEGRADGAVIYVGPQHTGGQGRWFTERELALFANMLTEGRLQALLDAVTRFVLEGHTSDADAHLLAELQKARGVFR